jgi:colanic acid/amylovoran biosynthesis glycosyltransferase
MKIAYLCSQYPAISHTFVLREVNALRRLGADIDTFSIRRAGSDHLLARADKAAFESTYAILPPRWPRLLATHARLAIMEPAAYLSTLALALGGSAGEMRDRLWRFFYFVEACLLWAECRRRGIRHIHVHFANVAADVAMLAAHLGSAVEPERPWSWSFTMHGPTEFSDVSRYRLAEKLRRARFVVCISDYARSQLMALSEPAVWNRLHVVHCGVPLEQFTNSRNGDARLADPKILYLGRLVPEKGQAILLEAVSLLSERGHAVNVVLAGEGPSRPELELIAERLGIASLSSFLGAVGQEEICALYADASIFCLPSYAEGVPVVLMEAMAMELPVVSTRIAGIPELIDDGQTGLLVSPGRPDELADALQQMLDDPSLRSQMGSRGREKVISEFSTDRLAEQLHARFNEELLGV